MAQKMSTMELVQSEGASEHPTRQPLYRELGRQMKRRVVCFYTSFSGGVSILQPDAEVIEEVVAHTKGPKPITLVVNSPGGDGVEAERIVRVCRKLSGDDFEVVVPRMAKSAATLICFGANRILMSPTSELGPVDPQVPWRTATGLRLFPTRTLVETYDELMSEAMKTTGHVEPYLQQLQTFNAGEVRQWRKFEELTREMAWKLLACHQMKGKSKSWITKRISIFTDTDKTLEHSRPIFSEDANGAGLNVQVEEAGSKTWKPLRELHARCSHYLSRGLAKLVESQDRSLSMREP